MQIKPVVGSVVGPTSETHWGQVLHLPNAYGVVEVSFADGGARPAGIHLLSLLSRKLSENPTSLKALEEIVDGVASVGVESLLVCVPVGEVAYVAVRGSGDVYLKRGVEFAHLLHGVGAISGEVKPGDTLLLVSKQFTQTLTEEEIKGVFDHLTPEEVAERLTLLLHEKDSGEGSAAVIVQVHKGKDEEFPAPERTAAHPVTSLRRLVNDVRAHPRKSTAVVTVILVTLFGISVLLGLWRQTTRVKNQSVASTIVDARHALEEGVALLTLSPMKGRERLVTAKELLAPLRESVSGRSSEGREIQELYDEITENLTTAMQLYKVKPELFFDGALVKKEGNIAFIGFENTTMGVVDQMTQTVYALDVGSKKVTVLGGGQTYAGLSYAAVHGDKLYVLTDTGVNMARLSDKQTVGNVAKKDSQWGEIRALVSYGGNLYLLDTTKSRIWKYGATDNGLPAGRQGFSELREYLNPDTLPDLSSAVTMAIDGSVWLGTSNGKILKFTGGREDSFTPKGVDPPFGSTLTLYTSDETKNLYILDSKNRRVVILEKDGTYLAQYVWEEAFTATQLAVSEEQKKIYLLSDGKLYAIALK